MIYLEAHLSKGSYFPKLALMFIMPVTNIYFISMLWLVESQILWVTLWKSKIKVKMKGLMWFLDSWE